MAKALAIYAGETAARTIAEEGWSPQLFDLLLGASGGPKWFVLNHLDRFLFGDFLQRSQHPLSVLGSSIGSWRHACLAMPDPVAAIDALEQGYLYQRYSRKPTAQDVSAVSRNILASILGKDGGVQLLKHPRIQTHIVTARGRGASASTYPPLLAAGMAMAALSNTVNRRLLNWHFQRVVFHSGPEPQAYMDFDDFETKYCALDASSVLETLHASGAIPFVLTGERNIPRAPTGQYWDGGIIDYHFDVQQYHGQGLVLYPHFSADVIPGWFDKFAPRRRTSPPVLDKLVMLCPSADFIADLPYRKIPDRSDFKKLQGAERIRYWEHCIVSSRALAEEFAEVVQQSDPLRGVTVLN